jgi:hypothetical protein
MFRASELELEGANEKRLHSVEFKNLPAGNYILRAAVLGRVGYRDRVLVDIETDIEGLARLGHG